MRNTQFKIFEDFLEYNEIRLKFYHNLAVQSKNPVNKYRELVMHTDPIDYLTTPFKWADTFEGMKYWEAVDKLWQQQLKLEGII